MLEFSLHTNLPESVSEFQVLHAVTTQIRQLKYPDDQLVIYPSPDLQNAIVIGLDQFAFQQETRQLYTLKLEDGDHNVINKCSYYFALTDVDQLTLFALALTCRTEGKDLVDEASGWLFNKHTAVTRTIRRVAHGSRRIYAISAFRTLQPQRWTELSQQGKQVYDESVTVEARFERARVTIVDEERIPQHHAFYMMFEDQLMNVAENRIYTFDRYRREFENRLEVADLQKYDHICNEWDLFWKQFLRKNSSV